VTDRPPPVLVLAGGLATRMGGGDKGFRRLAGRTLLDHVLDRVRPQTDLVLLNANGDPARFAPYGLTVVTDTLPGHLGPLAGVLAGLEWLAAHAPDVPDLATVPTDTPYLPRDLVRRLLDARAEAGAELACAASGGRDHPVVGLWPVRLAADLRRAMLEEGARGVRRWTARFSVALADYPATPVDPFFNANRPEDLAG
jgi:molybdopterin-guanine dinucleotide biosynthesis protein A